jgi:hypothetical protein
VGPWGSAQEPHEMIDSLWIPLQDSTMSSIPSNTQLTRCLFPARIQRPKRRPQAPQLDQPEA